MLRTRKRWISLLVTLAMLVAFCLPAGTAFAATNYVDFYGTYVKVGTGDGVDAGSATLSKTEKDWSTVNAVYVAVTLPEDVTFANEIGRDNIVDIAGSDANLVSSDSNYLEFWVAGSVADVTIKFNGEGALNIPSDFSGDLRVNIEATGVSAAGIVFTESDNVLVAKVVPGDVIVKAGDPKLVKVGTGKVAAEITIEEARAGQLGAGEAVYFEILTDGVSFNSATNWGANVRIVMDNLDYDEDSTIAYAKVTSPSSILPGTLKFAPVLDIEPGVTGDIEISVWSADGNGAIAETTVVVAKVGEVTAKVTGVKDNDGTLYCGQEKLFGTSFKLETTDGTNMPEDKLITLTLNKGKFAEPPKFAGEVGKLYNSYKSVYWFTKAGLSKSFKIENFKVKANNDAEPGDITVTIGGDFGELGEVVIGKLAKPYSVTADKPNIYAEALNQAAGDITITEAAAGAISPDEDIVIEVPSGITIYGTPKVEVTEGNIKAGIKVEDNKIILDVTGKSSKKSVIKLTGIKYDTGRLALFGDVELKFKSSDDNSVMATVANAKVVSPTYATTTMKIGDPRIVINGVEKVMETAPYIKNSRTYVSITYAALALGVPEANIMWDGVNKKVTVIKGDRIAQFTIGSTTMTLNGNPIQMDTAPEIVNARTMMPVTWVALALGGNTAWDAETQTVTITVE